MLKLHIMDQFKDLVPIVSDITVATVLSFGLSMALIPLYTNLAYRYKWWKKPRHNAVTGEKAPVFYKLHAAKHKRNIPTMAGAVLIIAITAVTLIFNLDRRETWLPLATLVLFGGLGLADDISNVFFLSDKRGGLKPRTQLLALIAFSAVTAWWFFSKLGYNDISIPFLGEFSIGWGYIPLFMLVVIATAKSVSITDGLDGLAGGLLSFAFSAFTLIALLQGNVQMAVFCATVAGATLAYTWFNIFPARFFMGQTGSTALGATLGVIAMLSHSIFLLPIIGGVFVAEAGSSLLQVMSKKILKRKIFQSAPIHHHFEATGWPETKVTMRFWILGAVCAVMGVVIAVVGKQI